MTRSHTFAALLLATSIAIGTRSNAMDVLPPTQIHSPKECPEGLRIASTSTNGMIDVIISIDPDKVEQNELYKGRVKATCHLDLHVGKDRVAYTQLQGNAKKRQTVFRFKISAAAARASHLHLKTHLYEANGVPTVGGGRTFRIHLAGLVAADAERMKPSQSRAKQQSEAAIAIAQWYAESIRRHQLTSRQVRLSAWLGYISSLQAGVVDARTASDLASRRRRYREGIAGGGREATGPRIVLESLDLFEKSGILKSVAVQQETSLSEDSVVEIILNVDWEKAFQMAPALFAPILGEPDVVDDVLKALAEDRNGPRVDLHRELISRFKQDVSVTCGLGADEEGQEPWVTISIDVTDPRAVEAALDRMFALDKGSRLVRVGDHRVWVTKADRPAIARCVGVGDGRLVITSRELTDVEIIDVSPERSHQVKREAP